MAQLYVQYTAEGETRVSKNDYHRRQQRRRPRVRADHFGRSTQHFDLTPPGGPTSGGDGLSQDLEGGL